MSPRQIVLIASDSREDQEGCEELAKHLGCKRPIDVWHRGLAGAGTDATAELRARVLKADLVVFLLSVDLVCDAAWEALRDELPRRLLLRRVSWRSCAPDRWERIPAVREHDRPLSKHENREAELRETAEALAALVTQLRDLPLLPRPVCPLFEDKLQEIITLLKTPQPVVILGAPGIGKSVLAAQAVHALASDNEDFNRACFVACQAATSVADIWSLLAEELEMPPGVSNRTKWISRAIQNRLIVLDGADRVWESARSDFTTMKQQLERDTGGRAVLTLRGQASPVGWKRVTPSFLTLEQSEALFFHLIDEDGARFQSAPQLADLLHASGGLPFVLVLLSQRVQYEPDLRSVWADWQARGASSLSGLDIFLNASLESPRITDGARALLAVLAWLPGGLLVSDVAAVMSPRGCEVISPLRETALIVEDDRDDRLRLPSPWRDYLQRQQGDDGRMRSQRYIFALVREHGPKVGTPQGGAAAQRIRDELANVLFLTSEGLREAGPEALDAAQAVLALVPFMRFSGLGDEALLQRAAAAAQRHRDHKLELCCHLGRADVMLAWGDYSGADSVYACSLELCLHDSLACDAEQARALIGRGRVAAYHCRAHEAADLYREALTTGKDQAGEAQARKCLGQAAAERGAIDEAIEHYAAALRLYRERSDPREEANCQRSLAVLSIQKDPGESSRANARRLLSEALRTLTDAADLRGQADCFRILGEVLPEDAEAKDQLQRALALYEQIHDARGQALSCIALGRLSGAANDHDDAYTHYQHALALLEGSESYQTLIVVYRALARIVPEQQQRSAFEELERATQAKLAAQRAARHGERPAAEVSLPPAAATGGAPPSRPRP